MKSAVVTAACFLLLCAMFWPWALALLDLMAWAVTGQAYTEIPWHSMRGVVLILYPWVVFLILACMT